MLSANVNMYVAATQRSKMGTVHNIGGRRGVRSKRVAFTKDELRQVLNVYSRRVSTGEWRDYAIGHYDGRAVFAVFRHTSDRALYAIEKVGTDRHGGKAGQFVLLYGAERLKMSSRLADVLAVLTKRPRLVASN